VVYLARTLVYLLKFDVLRRVSWRLCKVI
jgi:hypothetical protein